MAQAPTTKKNSMPDPIDWLRRRGNQARLRRLVKRLTGRTMSQSTTSRWATGEYRPDACAEALIRAIADPELLKGEDK